MAGGFYGHPYLGEVSLKGLLHRLFVAFVVDEVHQRLFAVYLDQIREVLLRGG